MGWGFRLGVLLAFVFGGLVGVSVVLLVGLLVVLVRDGVGGGARGRGW